MGAPLYRYPNHVYYEPIPSKFNSYIINSANFPYVDIQEQVFKAFNNPEALRPTTNDPAHAHILTHPGLDDFFIKRDPEGSDTALYRVRKAHKIQRLIQRNLWGPYVTVVTNKHLFYCNRTSSWYVLSKRIKLANNIRPLPHPSAELTMERNLTYLPITPIQAEAYATFAFEAALTDFNWGNIVFEEAHPPLLNRTVIIDTEPNRRQAKKRIMNTWYGRLAMDKSLLKLTQALAGLAWLKPLLCLQGAEAAVKATENRHILKSVIKSIITVSYIALAYLCVLTSAIPLITQVALVSLMGLKLSGLVEQNLLLYRVYTLSRQQPNKQQTKKSLDEIEELISLKDANGNEISRL